jgi:hypothetical protein
MRKVTDTISLFYSTTEDPSSQGRKKLVERVCKNVGQARSVAIHTIHWKDNIPGGVAERTGQSRINLEVSGAFDIYFGCMGVKYGAGTVDEFKQAIKSHMEKGMPAEVLFAFDETPVNPFGVPDGFSLVRDFRSSLEDYTRHGKSILYFSFCNEEEFEDRLFRDLNAAVRSLLSRIRGGMIPFS